MPPSRLVTAAVVEVAMFYGVVLILSLIAQAESRPFPLMVGDAAPPLRVERFVKGNPVRAFERGQVYVVEFWATWCGPCRESFPRLSAVQQKLGQRVRVIAVSVWEPRPQEVEGFVKQWDEKMAYTVAADKVEGVAARDEATRSREAMTKGLMSKSYLLDSGWAESGIPVAFVIDREGRVAWIGEPADLEKPLTEVVEGRYDLARAAGDYRRAMETEVTVRRLGKEARAALGAKRPEEALTLTEKILALNDKHEGQMLFKFQLLLKHLDRKDEAIHYMRERADRVDWSTTMNMAAAAAYDTPELSPQQLRVGVEVCQIALTKLGKDHTWPLMVMARLHHRLGEKQQAVACVDRALAIAKGNDKKKFEEERKRYEAGGR